MAADHNINFTYEAVLQQSFRNQHGSFQPGSENSATGFSPGGMDSSGGINGSTGMLVTGNSPMLNNISVMFSTSSSPANLLLDPVKHSTAFSVDWTIEELEVLKQCLVTYSSEPNIMRYIKIAAKLPDKTVRDVAMRCRWMTKKEKGKRRKPEDYYAGKKIKDMKEKMIDSSSMANARCNQPEIADAYSFRMHDGNHNNQFLCEAPVIDSRTQQLLNDNAKLFHQIAVNLENNEIQNNIDLLYHSNENLRAILNSMSEMPGIMSQMPLMPVHVNENLMHSILPGYQSGARTWQQSFSGGAEMLPSHLSSTLLSSGSSRRSHARIRRIKRKAIVISVPETASRTLVELPALHMLDRGEVWRMSTLSGARSLLILLLCCNVLFLGEHFVMTSSSGRE
ncbi:hypothetical protein OPV22_001692 [Ensete ventricosum]|uniref:Myb-like domain-containing protein n=1 Tax=Ensete ventricosum TaxID=4639 RepID=A0AAV8RWE3_ENSVE|nr:hypothetical protein OPV22_001692 [Ensete ventricosum]